jgi:hypothetical protein
MRNKERGLHPCRPRSRYLQQREGRGFGFVGKRIKSEDFGASNPKDQRDRSLIFFHKNLRITLFICIFAAFCRQNVKK